MHIKVKFKPEIWIIFNSDENIPNNMKYHQAIDDGDTRKFRIDTKLTKNNKLIE